MHDRDQNLTHYAHIPIHGGYPLVRARLEEFAADELFEGQYDTILALDADSCATVFYRLDCIFDLGT